MHLTVRARHRSYGPTPPEAKVGIKRGQLFVDSAHDALANELRAMFANELFRAGKGFAKFRRDPVSGALLRAPETGHVQVEGYVLLSAPPDDVLDAIRGNLEVTKQFDVAVVR